MNPEVFAQRMQKIADRGHNDYSGQSDDPERDHCEADELLCEALMDLGFANGVKIYATIFKWYA